MLDIDTSKADLNLLVTLDALLTAGSVTGAARRLGCGQPAASHALRRLRELFGDPLFVRSGRTIAPTPRAEALRAPLARWLAEAGHLLRQDAGFDPSTTTRLFALRSPDILAPLLPRVITRLRDEAPAARLEVRSRARDDIEALEHGSADLLLSSAVEDAPGLRTRGLGSVRFGIVARRDHPALKKSRRLTVNAWVAYPHIMVRSGSSSRSLVATALERTAVQRRVGLVVPSFLAALITAAETDFFFAAPIELVRALAVRIGVVVVAPPIQIPSVRVAAVWHERFHADPIHRFFRTRILDEVARPLGR